jgi:nucleotide-binding universal stress UspA family protein
VEQEVLDRLTPELDAIAGSTGVPTTHHFRFGVPWREIAHEAHDCKADLLVIAPKRELAFGERLLFGHTAWRLVRKAPTDILVVHPDARKEAGPGIDGVLALVDRTEVSDRVIAVADMLADLGSAQRHLLTCLDYPNDVAMRRLPHAQKALARYHRQERERAESYLDEVTRDYPERWTHHLGEDWVVRECPKVVDKEDIDMVVIAATSKPRLAGLLIGSTAEKLLGRLPTSCYMARPEGWESPLDFDE